jgi:hypothetical protein
VFLVFYHKTLLSYDKVSIPDVIKLQDAVKLSVLELHAPVHSSEYFRFQPHEHLNSEACEVIQTYRLVPHEHGTWKNLLYESGFHT